VIFDQFTRWTCPKCGSAGIDSWNKAMFDGVRQEPDDLPNPWILGLECDKCLWPCVVSYTTPDQAPRAIFAPNAFDHTALSYVYEPNAMRQLAANPASGVSLAPSDRRDADWSRGCLAAKGQLQ